MNEHDNMHSNFEFHAKLYALADKASVKEVTIDYNLCKSNIVDPMREKNNSKDSVNCKRFWLVDYPIMCYIDENNLP